MNDPIKAMAESIGLPVPQPGDVNDWGPKLEAMQWTSERMTGIPVEFLRPAEPCQHKALGSPLSPEWKALAAHEYATMPKSLSEIMEQNRIRSQIADAVHKPNRYTLGDLRDAMKAVKAKVVSDHDAIGPFPASPTVTFDFVTMAEDLPKAPEPEKRVLHEDIDLNGWRKRIANVMTPKWLPY